MCAPGRSSLVRLVSLLACAGILAIPLRARAVTEAAAPSLIIPPGARACALGQSYGAVADDPTAIYWNPAGLAWQEGAHTLFLRNQLIPALATDVYYTFAAATLSCGGFAGGFSYVYLDYGRWTATSPEGVELGTFASYERSFALTLAWAPEAHVAIGATLKTIKESLVPVEIHDLKRGVASSWASDFGLLLRSPYDIVRGGLIAQNVLGPELEFIDAGQSAPLPQNARLSLAVFPHEVLRPFGYPTVAELIHLNPRLWRDHPFEFLISREINKPMVGIDHPFREMLEPGFWHGGRDRTTNRGWEVKFIGLFSFRRGHISDPDGDIVGDTHGWGVSLPTNDYVRFSVDFARVPKAQGIGTEDKWSIWLGLGPALLRW